MSKIVVVIFFLIIPLQLFCQDYGYSSKLDNDDISLLKSNGFTPDMFNEQDIDYLLKRGYGIKRSIKVITDKFKKSKEFLLKNDVRLPKALIIYKLFPDKYIYCLKNIRIPIEQAIVETNKYMKKHAPIKFDCTPKQKIVIYGETHVSKEDRALSHTLMIEDQITNGFIYGLEGKIFNHSPVETDFLNLLQAQYHNIPVKNLGLDLDHQPLAFKNHDRDKLITMFMTNKYHINKPYKDFKNNNKSIFGIESDWEFIIAMLPSMIYFTNTNYYNQEVKKLFYDFIRAVNDNKAAYKVWLKAMQEKNNYSFSASTNEMLENINNILLSLKNNTLKASGVLNEINKKFSHLESETFKEMITYLKEVSYNYFFTDNTDKYFIPSYVKKLYYGILDKDYDSRDTKWVMFSKFVTLSWRNITIANNISELYCKFANPRDQTLLINIGYKHLKGLELLLKDSNPNIDIELISPHVRDDKKISLIYAIRNDRTEDAKFLIDEGANVNAKDKEGKTPLMYAIYHKTPMEVVTLLIENGADVNARDKKGRPPLVYAIHCGSPVEVVNLLIENGADVNPDLSNGGSLLIYAVMEECDDIAELLRSSGAHTNAIDYIWINPILRPRYTYKLIKETF